MLSPFSKLPFLPRELKTTSGIFIRGTELSILFLLFGEV